MYLNQQQKFEQTETNNQGHRNLFCSNSTCFLLQRLRVGACSRVPDCGASLYSRTGSCLIESSAEPALLIDHGLLVLNSDIRKKNDTNGGHRHFEYAVVEPLFFPSTDSIRHLLSASTLTRWGLFSGARLQSKPLFTHWKLFDRI